MSTTNKSPKILASIIAALLTFASFTANAAPAPAPPGVLETFVCNYKDGQGIDDLLAARDFLVTQAGKAGVALEPAYVWSLFKGAVDIDFVWLSIHQNLASFGAASDQSGPPEMAGVGAKFGAVADCQNGVMEVRPVFQGSGTSGPPAQSIISGSACNIRDGVNQEGMADLEGHIAGVLGASSAHNNVAIFAGTPMTGGPNTPDMFLFGSYENYSAWANGVTAIRGSAAGPGLGRHCRDTLDCTQALWNSQRVIDPPM